MVIFTLSTHHWTHWIFVHILRRPHVLYGRALFMQCQSLPYSEGADCERGAANIRVEGVLHSRGEGSLLLHPNAIRSNPLPPIPLDHLDSHTCWTLTHHACMPCTPDMPHSNPGQLLMGCPHRGAEECMFQMVWSVALDVIECARTFTVPSCQRKLSVSQHFFSGVPTCINP